MIKEQAVEGSVHTIVDVIHEHRFTVVVTAASLGNATLRDDVHGEGEGGCDEEPARLGDQFDSGGRREEAVERRSKLAANLPRKTEN